MPMLRFDLIEGRSPDELRVLLDAAHRAVLSAFRVPPRDRYQVVHQHPASEMVVEDTGLGIPRTRNLVVLQVTSAPREQAMKEAFYRDLCRELSECCGIEASDVMVSLVTADKADWSFGHGRAQFLTGEL